MIDFMGTRSCILEFPMILSAGGRCQGAVEPRVLKLWVMTLGRVAGQVPNQQIPTGARESLFVRLCWAKSFYPH
jgi:hypothetical protein